MLVFPVINNGHIFPFALLHAYLPKCSNRSVSNYSKCLDKSDNLLVLFLPGDFPLIVLHILAPTELATFWSVAQLSFENLLVVLLKLILGFLDGLLSTFLLYSFILLKHILQWLSEKGKTGCTFIYPLFIWEYFYFSLILDWKFGCTWNLGWKVSLKNYEGKKKKNEGIGNSLTVQWLKLRTSTWRGWDVVHPTCCVVQSKN